MRVVAGALRGRRIESPQSDATRPTTDKVREAVFNSLISMGEVEGARVLDAFAGTGAMGIEALSRGAAHCTFVERDRSALTVLRRNLDTLDLTSVSTVSSADAMSPSILGGQYDIVIADPPYGFDDWPRLLSCVAAPLVIAESDRTVGTPENWESVRERRYGRTMVTFLRRHQPTTGTVGGK